ncbi:hypothetical protein [Rhodoferax sp.]
MAETILEGARVEAYAGVLLDTFKDIQSARALYLELEEVAHDLKANL